MIMYKMKIKKARVVKRYLSNKSLPKNYVIYVNAEWWKEMESFLPTEEIHFVLSFEIIFLT